MSLVARNVAFAEPVMFANKAANKVKELDFVKKQKKKQKKADRNELKYRHDRIRTLFIFAITTLGHKSPPLCLIRKLFH